jgi:hypothetical protein
MDDVAYRVGFVDACDTIFNMIRQRKDVSDDAKNEILPFVMSLRQAKAESIIADLELYRGPVRVIVAEQT